MSSDSFNFFITSSGCSICCRSLSDAINALIAFFDRFVCVSPFPNNSINFPIFIAVSCISRFLSDSFNFFIAFSAFSSFSFFNDSISFFIPSIDGSASRFLNASFNFFRFSSDGDVSILSSASFNFFIAICDLAISENPFFNSSISVFIFEISSIDFSIDSIIEAFNFNISDVLFKFVILLSIALFTDSISFFNLDSFEITSLRSS